MHQVNDMLSLNGNTKLISCCSLRSNTSVSHFGLKKKVPDVSMTGERNRSRDGWRKTDSSVPLEERAHVDSVATQNRSLRQLVVLQTEVKVSLPLGSGVRG